MILLPAIDLFGGQAVRLYQGDYNQMTVYDPDPLHTVRQFERAGATHLHLVDLEGAKTGRTTNLPVIQRIAAQTNLLIEVGGGIRTVHRPGSGPIWGENRCGRRPEGRQSGHQGLAGDQPGQLGDVF